MEQTFKVAILGGSGLLGSTLQKKLSEADFLVSAPTSAEVPIDDEGAVRSYLETTLPDAVINAAALIDVDYCEEHREEAMRINGFAPGMLFKLMGGICPKSRFIQVSTSDVFGGTKAPYAENAIPDPINAYGRSKAEGEKSILQNLTASSEYAILRMGWLYGPGRRTFVDAVASSLREHKHIAVVTDQYNIPVHVHDAAEAIRDLLQKEVWRSGIYHLSSRPLETVSRFTIASEIAAILRAKETYLEKTERSRIFKAPRPENTTLIHSADLTAPNWKDSLRRYIMDAYGA